MKHEAKAQIEFSKYLREKKPQGYFELKYTDREYLPFGKIEPHQFIGLEAAEKSGFVWKLSDQDQRQKPFDAFCAPPMPAYIVISFGRYFYFVRVRDIIRLKDEGKLSIKREEAQILAEKIVGY